ncbi:hypothetical protein [Accumulibacter sp.]|uniref:hypothetical protein n=1 Tax=Accumulibacter sp. TaxID=2053492 RepID=UPI0028C50DDA|nr:hypothetical protein [Accumulibacter sp.]
MTTRIKIGAAEVRPGDLIYNGLGTSKHPTDTWETITQVNVVDGLIFLITGRLSGPHGEFWYEPDELVAVVRHPPEVPEPVVAKPHNKRSHGH